MARSFTICVGCYTEPVPHAPGAHGKGLQILEIDASTGDVTTIFEYGAVPNPAFVQPHPTLPVIYAVSEVWTGPGTISSLRFTPDHTTLLARTELPSGGDNPCYVSVVGDLLMLSNYGDGSLVSYRLLPSGDLAEQLSRVQLVGSGPDLDRQEGSHAHCLLAHPSNGFLYAADLGADLVLRLSLDQTTGGMVVVGETAVPGGSGPRHLVFTPSGGQALLVEEMTSTLAVFDVVADGGLVLAQRLSTLPPDAPGPSSGADIVVAPAGDAAYASNRGDDSVVTLRLGPGGSWYAASWTPTDGVPRGLALSSDGSTLLVANQGGETLQLLEITPTGPVARFRLPSATPTAVRFLAVEAG